MMLCIICYLLIDYLKKVKPSPEANERECVQRAWYKSKMIDRF